LNVLNEYAKFFACPVGLSDHSDSIYPSIAAVAMGATTIEKHFTIDRNLPGTDQTASILPSDLQEMVTAIEITEKAMGTKNKDSVNINNDVKKLFRHGLVAKVDIPKGTEFSLTNVDSKRPEIGVSCSDVFDVIGRIASEDTKKGSPIYHSSYVKEELL
jgi:N,N'-diacetyllegionaminate synthase